MADNFFCLDIGEIYIKTVDSVVVNKKCNINAIGITENNNQFYTVETDKNIDEVALKIKSLVETNKIVKKNVHCIIPDTYTYSQILEMPNLNEKELISAIRYQADQFIPMPIDETNIDIEILYENPITKKATVLMIAAPKKIVDKIQSTTELAGLIPVSLENSLSATSRFFSNFFQELSLSNQSVVLVNMELNSTSLYFFSANNNLLLYNHIFPIGFQLFCKELQINTSLDEKKAIEILQTYNINQTSSIAVDKIISPLLREYLVEIKKFITTVAEKTKMSPQKIFFINDSLKILSLPQFVNQSANIPTNYLNVSPIFSSNQLSVKYKNSLTMFVSVIGGNLR